MRFLAADRIFTGDAYLEDDKVLVLTGQNMLSDIVNAREIDPLKIKKYEGCLSPGFVNAHGHLELSHMKGLIPEGTGLVDFALQVISKRDLAPDGEKKEHMVDADAAMYSTGIVAAGDISNTAISFPVKSNSKIYYHTFVEVIGLDPNAAETIFSRGMELEQQCQREGLAASIAPHAPYSCSTQLIERIARHDHANGVPLSIHNQESPEEDKFFLGNSSRINDLYKKLNLDISWFVAPRTTSLRHYAGSLNGCDSILVHNTFAGVDDIAAVSSGTTSWCLCPLANIYIENRLPDFQHLKASGNLCLGTDSLASNHLLDLVAEANRILASTDILKPEELLTAMTSGGAKALRISGKYGRLKPCTSPGINLVAIKDNRIEFKEKIA